VARAGGQAAWLRATVKRGSDIVGNCAENSTSLVRGRHFQDQFIVLCVKWRLRYCLTLRDLEEMMAERGLGVDHSTIGRWALRYPPELHRRISRDTGILNRS
jgi:transposase-like protein